MELEQCGEDMDKMAELLDEMEELNKNATDLDMTLLDRNIDKMMPELGFSPDDNDQLVAAYRYNAFCVFLGGLSVFGLGPFLLFHGVLSPFSGEGNGACPLFPSCQ